MSAEARREERAGLFANPGAEYRGKPFWAWNGELRKEELIRQIHVLKEMGFGGYFMHSRTGLLTEYLGEEWFALINAGADEGERLGMETWLYDEDRWPSGSAGGKVSQEPKYRMKSLVLMEMTPEDYCWKEEIRQVFVAKVDGINLACYEEVGRNGRKEKTGENLVITKADIGAAIAGMAHCYEAEPGEWRVLCFAVIPDACNSNYNGTTYIDTMNREAVEQFLALTHEKYCEKCGSRMGTSIKGIFTDEPHRGKGMGDVTIENGMKSCPMAWTDDLFEEFEKRYGYDARKVLPELFYRFRGEAIAPVKHDYFDLANNLFLERFADPVSRWCREHKILFTGHVLHEDSMTGQAVPGGSVMRFYPYMDYPGVDVLQKNNPCYWTVKQLSSAARQTGQTRLLSELYGCTGWEMTLKEHKMVGDWQALLGINLRCPHLSWYTMEGQAKRDYPASILHQSPWSPYYETVESYFARFGQFMTWGKPVCDVLVLNPVESVWSQCYLGWSSWVFAVSEDVKRLEEQYQELCRMLLRHQIDFDYGEEQMITSMYRIERTEAGEVRLCVGEMKYKVVVVSGMLTIRNTTLQILQEFIEAGGSVLFAGPLPEYVDARRSEKVAGLAERGVCVPLEEKQFIETLHRYSGESLTVYRPDGSPEKGVFGMIRDFGEAQGIVLLNMDSQNEKRDRTICCSTDKPYHCQYWDMETGKRYDADRLIDCQDGVFEMTVSLPAAGTKAFLLTEERDETLEKLPCVPGTVQECKVTGSFAYQLSEKNVCVLDFARWRWADGSWSQEQEILKADEAVRDSLGLEHRGGEMLQPWFIKKNGENAYGELELEYRFLIDTLPKAAVTLAVERPERMHCTVNGRELQVQSGVWIDVCFKRLQIPAGVLQEGDNIVTVRTTYTDLTNLEALYLLGDFGVRIDGHKVILTELSARLDMRNRRENGLPFYTGEITYYLTPEHYKGIGCPQESERILLSPKASYASMYRITAAGQEHRLLWDPFEADVTEAVRAGQEIGVTVVGNRRNTFGPLHLLPRTVESYAPFFWNTTGEEWSDDYELLEDGLTEVLLRRGQ